MTDHKTEALASWIDAFAAEASRPVNVKRWVDDTVEAILVEVPEIDRTDVLATVIRDAVAEHWPAFLRQLRAPVFTFHLVDRAHNLAVEVANSRLSVETLIRFHRVALQTTWTYIGREIEKPRDVAVDQAAILIYFWDRASQWIDEAMTASIATFHEERGRAQAGAAAQRYETVLEVLAGKRDDPRRISAALGGYPLSVTHTAVVLTCDNHDGVAELEHLAHRLAREVGAAQPLLVRPGGRRLWVWIGSRSEPRPDVIAAEFERHASPGTRAGVGSGASGVSGFTSSFKEAEGAVRLAGVGSVPRLCRYSDVELLVILGCTPQVDRFVSRTLGALAGSDDASARRRETIAAYLDAGGSFDDAAAALQVHRNTVRYRIAQVEKMLDRSISRLDPAMTVALHHLDAFHPDGSIEPGATSPS